VHKQANEGTARVYWRDGRLASVGLRPHVVYGPGRDHGLTAGPTLAMLAAARGEGYEIPFGGRAQFQYVADVARLFIEAARSASTDAVLRNVGGPSEHLTEVISAIEAVSPNAAGRITFKPDVLLPLPEDMDSSNPVTTPLRQGGARYHRIVGARQPLISPAAGAVVRPNDPGHIPRTTGFFSCAERSTREFPRSQRVWLLRTSASPAR
jgi:nucleoside-diphosphate-sugar epimerase